MSHNDCLPMPKLLCMVYHLTLYNLSSWWNIIKLQKINPMLRQE